MFNKAQKDMDDHLSVVDKWEDFLSALDNKNIIMAPFCGDPDWSVEFGFLLKYKQVKPRFTTNAAQRTKFWKLKKMSKNFDFDF